MSARPRTYYARSGEAHVAYQVTGEGPVDWVVTPGFVSHLDLQWESVSYRRFIRQLAVFARVIRYDKRGTGLSDPVAAVPASTCPAGPGGRGRHEQLRPTAGRPLRGAARRRDGRPRRAGSPGPGRAPVSWTAGGPDVAIVGPGPCRTNARHRRIYDRCSVVRCPPGVVDWSHD